MVLVEETGQGGNIFERRIPTPSIVIDCITSLYSDWDINKGISHSTAILIFFNRYVIAAVLRAKYTHTATLCAMMV